MKLFLVGIIIGIVAIVGYLNFQPAQVTNQHVAVSTAVTPTSFSLAQAPSSSLKVIIRSLTGAVQWQSRTATEPATLTTPRELLQGEGIVTQDNGSVALTIATIANITLAAKTTLNFVQTLPADIVISQDVGTVTYEKIDTTPLSIQSLDLLVNIPEKNSLVAITTTKSVVTVSAKKGTLTAAYNSIDNITKVVTIKPGQDFVFNDATSYGSLE